MAAGLLFLSFLRLYFLDINFYMIAFVQILFVQRDASPGLPGLTRSSCAEIFRECRLALHSSRFIPRYRRSLSVSNLPFVKMADFWIKIACFAIGVQPFAY